MSKEVMDRTGAGSEDDIFNAGPAGKMAGPAEDTDVFRSASKNYVIPKDAPVLPSMASRGGVELVVKDDGSSLVIFDTPQLERVHWVEYDMDLDLLTFVTWSGKVFGLGMKIHAPFRKYLKQARSLYLILMKNGETPTEIDNVVMIVRRIGF